MADDIAQALTALGALPRPRHPRVAGDARRFLPANTRPTWWTASPAGVGVVWDILHPYRCGEALADTVNYLGGHIGHVHVKDAVELSPTGFRPVLLGEGEVPVREALRLLLQTGYSGALSFEWEKAWYPEIPEPEVAFPQFIAPCAPFCVRCRLSDPAAD